MASLAAAAPRRSPAKQHLKIVPESSEYSARLYYLCDGRFICDCAIRGEQLDLLLHSKKNNDVKKYLLPLALRTTQNSVKAGAYPFSKDIAMLLVEYIASLGIVVRSVAAKIVKDIHVIIHNRNGSFSVTLKHRSGAFTPSELL